VFPRIGALIDYDAASGSRRVRGWAPSSGSANTVLFSNLETLRARSRDQVRKNPWAKNGLDSFVGNCVGTGIKPQSQHPDAAVRAAIHKLWNRWTDEADADGAIDFYGMQSLVCREIMEAGECLERIRMRRPKDGLSVPLQLQGLEPEHLPLSKTEATANGNIIRAGIEIDKIGQRQAYWLYRSHPGDSYTNPGDDGSIVRVPAQYVLHQRLLRRFGALRGEPWLAQVLMKMWQLDQFDDATLRKAKAAAFFAAFVTRPGSPDAGTDMLGGTDQGDGTSELTLEPETLQVLEPGENITWPPPVDGGSNYETFIRTQLRAVAAGMGVTYEQLTGDLKGVTYSSLRHGLLEFRRRCEQLQYQVMVFQFCRPVYRAWIDAAITSGALRVDPNDPDVYEVEWITPGWDWVDPLKDVQASELAVRGGFTTRSKIVAGQGYNSEVIDAEQAADNKRADDAGVKYDSDGRQAKSGSNAAAQAPTAAADQQIA